MQLISRSKHNLKDCTACDYYKGKEKTKCLLYTSMCESVIWVEDDFMHKAWNLYEGDGECYS